MGRGACVQREIGISQSIGLAYSGKEIYHFCFVFFVLLCIRGQIPSTSPRGAYTWRVFCITILGGLYLEGLIFGILQYFLEISKTILLYTLNKQIQTTIIFNHKNRV